MPPRARDHYLTTTSSRPDFTWFFFKPPASTLPRKRKADSTTSDKVRSARRGKLPSAAEKSRQALMAPADVKVLGQTARTRQKAAKSKKSKSRNPVPKDAGPWSEWYISEDNSHLWRARLLENETWDYEFAPTTPTTSSSQLSQPLSLIPEQSPASPGPILSCDPISPKVSWPTIITASTCFPTDDLDASSSRTPATLAQEIDNLNQAYYPVKTALVPLAAISKPSLSRVNSKTTTKRPVGPVMRLLQEGRSRKRNKEAKTQAAKTQAAKSYIYDNTTAHMLARDAGDDNTYYPPYWGEEAAAAIITGQNSHDIDSVETVVQTRDNRVTAVLAKKLHAKVKSEKALRADPKRKVKTWLKGVELDLAPIPLDALGLPVY